MLFGSRLSRGRRSGSPRCPEPTVHGEAAPPCRRDLFPRGRRLSICRRNTSEDLGTSMESACRGLAAGQAAVAALFGKPVSATY